MEISGFTITPIGSKRAVWGRSGFNTEWRGLFTVSRGARSCTMEVVVESSGNEIVAEEAYVSDAEFGEEMAASGFFDDGPMAWVDVYSDDGKYTAKLAETCTECVYGDA